VLVTLILEAVEEGRTFVLADMEGSPEKALGKAKVEMILDRVS
jgi:hypothetical protein